MGKNQSTYTLKIDAELGDLQKSLNAAKASLASFMASGNAPKGLEKAFEKVNQLLGQISDKTGKPLDVKGLTSTEKDLDSLSDGFRSIIRLLGDFEDLSDDVKLSFVDAESQKQIQQAINALRQYEKTAVEASKKVKELSAAQKEMSKSVKEVDKNKASVSNLTGRKGKKEAEVRGKRGQLEAINVEGANPEKIAKYRAELLKLEADLADIDRQLADANAALERSSSAYATSANSVAQLENELNQINQGSLEQLKQAAQEAGLSLEELDGKEASEQLEILTKRISDFKKEATSGGQAAFNAIKKGCTSASGAVSDLKEKVEEATEATIAQNEVSANQQAFEAKIKSFLGLSGAAQVLKASLRDAMQTIQELDATMTQMSVVTDLSVGDYWDKLPEYTKRANELGLAINDVYKADTLFYQQGLKTNEVVQISTETMKMARIAGLDTAEATDRMTAALRGFNMELNDVSAQKISDVYSELAAITAADVDEISTAMTKTASIASSAGMEFETTAAFLSQIIETTRESAETAGTAMKTVIARFQELKKDPSEIGEIDGEIVDANKIETALRSVGVSLRDAKGQFRDLDDVFMELSSKWDGLDKNTQRYIATIAAGSRQQSRFIAMMSDYGRTQELVTAANNSAGASQQQFEKTLESLESKLEKLKNAWHEFTMGIMNSDFLKLGVDILTKFLEMLNKITSGFGGMLGSITKISTVIGIFKLGKSIFDKFKGTMVKFLADVVKESGLAGERSGVAFKEGMEKGVTQPLEQINQGEETKTTGITSKVSSTVKTGVEKLKTGNVAGVGQFKEASQHRQNAKAAMQVYGTTPEEQAKSKQAIDQKRKELAEKQAQYTFHENGTSSKKGQQGLVNREETEKVKKEMADLKAAIDKYDNATKEAKESSDKMWSSISGGIKEASATLMGVGVAFGMVGSAFEKAGLDGAAEVFNKMSQYATTASTVLGLLPPILSIIQALFPGVGAASTAAGAAATTAGVTASASWSIVGVIILAVIAAVAVALIAILAIMKLINNMSPEKKLQDAQKAADDAAESAERAAEAFDQLNDSLEQLDDKYEALEGLREGTEEWNKAIQEVNDSVLSLIEKYPELAGLVENKGGVLTLDIDSEGVQAVLQDYKAREVNAKGVEIAAKADVNYAQRTMDFAELDAIDRVASQRGWQAEGKSAAIGGAIGAGLGAIPGAVVGSIFGPIGSVIAGGISAALVGSAGAITGALVGAIVGPIKAANTRTDEALQDATEKFAMDVLEYDIDVSDVEKTTQLLIDSYGIAADEARVMAESFAENTDELLEYGASISARKAQEDAYYTAMSMNAKQMFNVEAYSTDEQGQMDNVVDNELIKQYEKEISTNLTEASKDEFEQAQQEFVLETYGEEARIDGDKIVDAAGNTLREFDSDEAWINAMAAAEATQKAAKSMQQVPGLIDKAANAFNKKVAGYGNVVEKAFAQGADALTKGELEKFEKIAADESTLEDLYNSDAQFEEIYGSLEEFKDSFSDIAETAQKQFSKAFDNAKDLGIGELSEKLSSEAALGWTEGLKKVFLTGSDTSGLNSALNNVLSTLNDEQTNEVMAQINAIDKTNIAEWENLATVFEELGVSIPTDALNNFIQKGIEVSNAIHKINFDTLADGINNTQKLIDKIKSGGRTYDEDDYKELISANKNLEKTFRKVGDEYIYVGGSMKDLTDAVEQNTVALLQEANRQLESRSNMSSAMSNAIEKGEYGAISTMSQLDLAEFVLDMKQAINGVGGDISDFGIEGLDKNTSVMSADKETLLTWANALMVEANKDTYYQEEAQKKIKEANILRFTDNSASYNAQQAANRNNEYADAHQEALLLQAVQSGMVSDELIDAYRTAMKNKDYTMLSSLGEQIAASVSKAVESSEGRDAYQELIDKTVEAIEKLRQDQIDKLSEVNDSINTANDKLVNKIEQQIAEERQERENQEQEKSISELQSKQAYLAMDTSGTNALSSVDLDKQIAEAEQSYQDSLVDQALQNLQDSNQQAAEQRERQIAILEQQLQADLASGAIADAAAQVVSDSINQLRVGTILDKIQMGAALTEADEKLIEDLGLEDELVAFKEGSILKSNVMKEVNSEQTNSLLGGLGLSAEANQTALETVLEEATLPGLGDLPTADWYKEIGTLMTSTQNWFTQQANGSNNTSGGTTSTTNTTGVAAGAAVGAAVGSGQLQPTVDKQAELDRIKLQTAQLVKGANGARNGAKSLSDNEELDALEKEYVKAKGAVSMREILDAAGEFRQYINKVSNEEITSGSIDNVNVSGLNSGGGYWGDYDSITVELDGTEYDLLVGHTANGTLGTTKRATDTVSDALTTTVGEKPKNGWIAMYAGIPYIYIGEDREAWFSLDANPKGESDINNFTKAYLQKLRKFKAGGLADFTGPAWLDGTPSKPEYILNADQTQKFFSLVDVLEGLNNSDGSARSGGDNYFDISINVEKLDSDYDVEQIANKIRRMIYDDATYRNVNAVNNKR